MTNKVKWLAIILAFFSLAAIYLTNCDTQHSEKVYTISIINPNHGSQSMSDGFIEGLIEYSRNEKWELYFRRMPINHNIDNFTNEMVSLPVDLIYSVTTPATKKVIKASKGKNIPGIFTMLDPVGSGIIDNLSRPGGNITGIQLRGSVPKALDWLITVVPEAKHLFVPIKFDTKAASQSLSDLKDSADSIGIKLTVAEVESDVQLNQALASIPDDADAIFLLHSIFISSQADKIATVAIQKKLPTAAATFTGDQGIMLSYSNKHSMTGRQASRLAFMVLNGSAPGDIPTEIADFFLGINLKTAQKIGITIPDSVLVHADEIIR